MRFSIKLFVTSSVLLATSVAGVAMAATTISTDVNTGGNLFVSLTSNLYGTTSFGGTATSSFSTAGALSLASALTAPNGGTGSTTLSGLLVGNGAGAVNSLTLPSFLSLSGSTLSLGTLAIANGGSGVSTAPTYGQILVGNGSGGYTLTATSSLGLGGTGTVTSVNASGGTTGLSFSGGPVSTSGTLTLAGTLGVANGGTGSTTMTGILVGNGASTPNTLVLPTSFLTLSGSTLSLGTLAIANGGSGVSTAPTYGQILVGNGSGGYTLTATSSLGLSGSGASLSAANTWTALQQFNGAASTTLLSVYGPTYFGATATSSFSSTGALTLGGPVTLPNNSSTLNSIIFGSCTISNSATITASSTGFFNCTGATNVTNAYTVFVQATASLPANLVIQSASSTVTTGTINLQIYNMGWAGALAPGAISVNYWAFR